MWDEWPGLTPGPERDPSLSGVGSRTADDSSPTHPPLAWVSSVVQARPPGGGWLGLCELALRVTSLAVQKSVFNKMLGSSTDGSSHGSCLNRGSQYLNLYHLCSLIHSLNR